MYGGREDSPAGAAGMSEAGMSEYRRRRKAWEGTMGFKTMGGTGVTAD